MTGPDQPPGRRAAYFDVDGTLTVKPTIFELLRFDAGRSGRAAEAEGLLEELARMRAAGHGRAVRLRRYYAWWAGRSVSEVDYLASTWFAEQIASRPATALRTEVLDRLRGHQREGHVVVLVSGSFSAVVVPLAQYLRVHDVVTSRLLVLDGAYTGEVEAPMIGETKRVAVLNHAGARGIDLEASWAYGDDESDLPFLSLTGRPTLLEPPGGYALVGRRPIEGHPGGAGVGQS